jgi:methylmalonyl-CoA epimerase
VNVAGVHHVAVAVEDLDLALETYERLFGAEVERRERVESQGVEAAYVKLGTGRIELVAPLAQDTPVGRFLQSRGPGMHHVAIVVDDLAEAVSALAQAGAEVVDAEPRPGVGGHAVSFVHPSSVHGVLVEVIANG